MGNRICKVTDLVSKETVLVQAATKSQALKFVQSGRFEVDFADSDELVSYANSGKKILVAEEGKTMATADAASPPVVNPLPGWEEKATAVKDLSASETPPFDTNDVQEHL